MPAAVFYTSLSLQNSPNGYVHEIKVTLFNAEKQKITQCLFSIIYQKNFFLSLSH